MLDLNTLLLFVIVITALTALGVVWVPAFCQLMALTPADFPGPHDKTLWAVGFFASPIFAPIAFQLTKRYLIDIQDKT